VAYDDDDDGWAKLDTEEKRERARREAYIASRELRQKVLRYTYAGLGVLLILVIVLALTR
jgi:hypothetical protein